jgi:hypothetical protein
VSAAVLQFPRAEFTNWLKGKRMHDSFPSAGQQTPQSSSLFGVSLKNFILSGGTKGIGSPALFGDLTNMQSLVS